MFWLSFWRRRRKNPVKSCVVIQEITGPFAMLRVTRTRNVLAVILTPKAEESSKVLCCDTRNNWTLRCAQGDGEAVIRVTGTQNVTGSFSPTGFRTTKMKKRRPAFRLVFSSAGARTRTWSLLVRSQTLYPVGLHPRFVVFSRWRVQI